MIVAQRIHNIYRTFKKKKWYQLSLTVFVRLFPFMANKLLSKNKRKKEQFNLMNSERNPKTNNCAGLFTQYYHMSVQYQYIATPLTVVDQLVRV